MEIEYIFRMRDPKDEKILIPFPEGNDEVLLIDEQWIHFDLEGTVRWVVVGRRG